MRGNVAVGGGIPQCVVDAVQDAVHVGGALAQDCVESMPNSGRLDLLGVFAANRGDGVGVNDAALEEVELA